MKNYKAIGGIIGGALLFVVGGLLIAFPTTAIFLHPAYEGGVYPVDEGGSYIERVTRKSSRVYGAIGLLLGIGLIAVSRWPRWSPRRAAIEDYVWCLSQDLSRRFGTKNYYRVEEVIRTADETSVRMDYIPYAHAMFCTRADFDALYAQSRLARAYDGLRAVIARCYFDGAYGFDAATVIRLARPPRDEEYDLAEGAGG